MRNFRSGVLSDDCDSKAASIWSVPSPGFAADFTCEAYNEEQPTSLGHVWVMVELGRRMAEEVMTLPLVLPADFIMGYLSIVIMLQR